MFANNYWSSDYRVGIDKISQQSIQSLHQLHDLRKLVFNYMNYSYSNSEFLNKLSEEAFQQNNSIDLLSTGSNNSDKSALKRLSEQFVEATRLDASSTKHTSTSKYMEHSLTPYKLHIHEITEESKALIALSNTIDFLVLEPITSFIKRSEPMIKLLLNEFEDLFEDYQTCYKSIEKIRKEFEEISSLKELEDRKEKSVIEDDKENDSSDEENDNILSRDGLTPSTPKLRVTSLNNSNALIEPIAAQFSFPLYIGPIQVKELAQLKTFLLDITTEIETVKRKFAIPGFKNESFSSENLCRWVSARRPFGINPTRLNLERFGQSLIDLKIIVGMGFIGAKKFKSEGMWFEWSEKVDLTLNPEIGKTVEIVVLEDQELTPSSTASRSSSGGVPVGGLTPPKKPNTHSFGSSILSNMRNTILKTNYSQILLILEQKYNDNYLQLQNLRHKLDSHTFNSMQKLEIFERERIALTYNSLTKLLEILYNSSLATSNRLHQFATDLITNLNKPENYKADFDKIQDTFSTGIYFPSILSPDNLSKKHYSSHQANSNFQNVKLKFNLYKDIELQPLLSDESEILSIRSIPKFLYKIISLLEEERNDLTKEDAESFDLWTSPLNGEKYWSMKSDIINLVNNFSVSTSIADEEVTIHRQILDDILTYCSHQSTTDLVNFIKYWLLEIGDSLIPFTMYERLLNEADSYLKLCSLLSTMPRGNLSSLVFLLEHISSISGLESIPNYGFSDNLADELISENPELEKVETVAAELNSMDLIGTIPFLHLMLRPSAVKHTSGFKPPLPKYNTILADLLNVQVRSKLFTSLIQNEQKYQSKKENQMKLPIPVLAPISNSESLIPKSPKASQSGENFTLRPFRTKATPNPSPSGSPKQHLQNSFEADITRPRSASNTYLAPNINVEFEAKK